MGTRQDVDAVDLEEVEPIERAKEPAGAGVRRTAPPEALRRKRDSPCLGE